MKKNSINTSLTSIITSIPLVLTLAAAGFLACIQKPDTAEFWDASSEIGAAIEYKRKECGHQPNYPLPVPANPASYGVRLCSLLITRQACPFLDYPLFCLEMYSLECDICDLPGIGG